ncbi:hypothetical protein ABZ595_10340 [Streptomyces rubradiris]|uniref:hypothetical protein n=1 Tax=Streptomyces rubradiris TaxID=285531 RepID=UPI0033F24B3F
MLSNDDLKKMASTVIEHLDTPAHFGTEESSDSAADRPAATNVTVVDGDNHGGIRQTFRR